MRGAGTPHPHIVQESTAFSQATILVRHGLPHFTEETVAQRIGNICLGSQNRGLSGSRFGPEANEGFKD